METKQQIADRIRKLLDQAPIKLGRGSSIPKELFEGLISELHLPIETNQAMPLLGERIVSHAGLPWDGACDSRDEPSGGGSTVTAQGLLRVLEAVHVLTGERANAPDLASVGEAYRKAASLPVARSDELSIDLDKLDQSCQAHETTQNALADYVASCGPQPLSPGLGDPEFDLAWRLDDVLVVCEVKSVHEANCRQQARLGLGQVMEYRTVLRLRPEGRVEAVLALSQPDVLAVRSGEACGVVVTSPDEWRNDLVHLLP